MTESDRLREAAINDIVTAARDFRHAHRLHYDDPVYIKIPNGAKHLITARDIEFLKVQWIYEEKN